MHRSTRLTARTICATNFATARRLLHRTGIRHAVTNFAMPAMSPTMTEGGIAQWKKKEGESFSAGDILLEIETDKATIDVEAQDDGIMGKILAQDGTKNIAVGKIIALLAEEGDDISNLEAPKESSPPETKIPAAQNEGDASVSLAESSGSQETSRSSSPPTNPPSLQTPKAISHSRPIFPSVLRLLLEYNVSNPDDIKGTGVRGMLTKGDVLAHLGKASSPFGTYKEAKTSTTAFQKKEVQEPLDGPAIRKLIVLGITQSFVRTASAPAISYDFDSVIADYLPTSKPSPQVPPALLPHKSSTVDYFDGLI